MDLETFGAILNIVKDCKKLPANSIDKNSLTLIENWIDEVRKEYTN